LINFKFSSYLFQISIATFPVKISVQKKVLKEAGSLNGFLLRDHLKSIGMAKYRISSSEIITFIFYFFEMNSELYNNLIPSLLKYHIFPLKNYHLLVGPYLPI